MADTQHSRTIGLLAVRLGGIVPAREQLVGRVLALVEAVVVVVGAAVAEAGVVVGAAGIELLVAAAQLETNCAGRR